MMPRVGLLLVYHMTLRFATPCYVFVGAFVGRSLGLRKISGLRCVLLLSAAPYPYSPECLEEAF
jgi:hypothetical protein